MLLYRRELAPIVALAFSLVLAGCISPAIEDPGERPGTDDADPIPSREVLSYAGTLRGAPIIPASTTHPFAVPDGLTEIKVFLNWTTRTGELAFVLIDPDGRTVATGFREHATSRVVGTVHPPAPGEWKVVVSSERALDEAYSLTIILEPAVAGAYATDSRKLIPAGGFAEINLILEANATFDYAWTLVQGGETYFNIHSHQDGETVRHVEGTYGALTGNFTAPSREVYSLLWRNAGLTDMSVDHKLAGILRVHSETRHTSTLPV